MNGQMRLQKYLAHCGVSSRRKAEEHILDGRVIVNGKVITELGFQVDTMYDNVLFDGKKVKFQPKRYIMLNKPVGYICTVEDEQDRMTVLELINEKERLYPIGRLDYNSSGMLLLTTDGDLTNILLHPRYNVKKVYEAKIYGIPTEEEIRSFKNGLVIDGYKTSKADFRILRKQETKSIVEITLYEGRNRQVRKMCDKIGHQVITLRRVGIGKLRLGNLEVGDYRDLNLEEIKYLKSLM